MVDVIPPKEPVIQEEKKAEDVIVGMDEDNSGFIAVASTKEKKDIKKPNLTKIAIGVEKFKDPKNEIKSPF